MAGLQSAIRKESAITLGALQALGVYLIYNNALPSAADIRTAAPHDSDAESARKAAAVQSAALLGIVFVISRDLNAFIIGGAAMLGIDTMYKHANGVHPATGKLDTSRGGISVAPDMTDQYSLPDYSDDASAA